MARFATNLAKFEQLADDRQLRSAHSSATRRDLHGMLMMVLPSMIASGRTRVDMEGYCAVREPELAKFMRLPHGVPSHDTFPAPFRVLEPSACGRRYSAWFAMPWRVSHPCSLACI